MLKTYKIYIAGHRVLIGSALVRRLHAIGYNNWSSGHCDTTNFDGMHLLSLS